MDELNRISTAVEFERDIDEAFLQAARRAGVVAWDIETSGLDWRTERIALCQVHIPSEKTAVVRTQFERPNRLAELLSDQNVLKVFHHALFDLRFMCSHWKIEPRNIACTKLASKISNRDWEAAAHSLKPLLQSRLGVILDKTEQVSDWFAATLSPKQIAYAISDVVHLVPLLLTLRDDLDRSGQLALADACFAHIPTRVELDLGGYGDVFAY